MSAFSRLFSIGIATPPTVAVEIAVDRVSAASIDWRGDAATLVAHATEPLAQGVVVPSLMATNIHNPAAVRSALESVLGRVGRPARIGLVLPDPVAKVSLLRFDQVPPRAQDLDALIRWQLRKAAPFPI